MLDRPRLLVAVDPHGVGTVMASRFGTKMPCDLGIARRRTPNRRCAKRRSSRFWRAAIAAARLAPC